jgi:hypothetical protein
MQAHISTALYFNTAGAPTVFLEMKSREILEAIKAIDDETHRDAAMNQLIISGNSSHDKLNSILLKISQTISTPSPSPTSSPLKEVNGMAKKNPTTLERYTSLLINNYAKIPENIPVIILHDFILLKLVQEMKTNISALESLASISSHLEGKKKLILIPNLLNSLVHNLLQPSSSPDSSDSNEKKENEEKNGGSQFFISSVYLFHNLLELVKTRQLVQQIDEFTKPDLYSKLYQSQNQFPIEIICSILMHISRTPISHQAMYAVDGVLSLLLAVIHTSHHPLVKLCLICIMNLSSEASNRVSMITNKYLLKSIITTARQHKGKVRQCSVGILLNLSFAGIQNPQIGLYLLQFPQAIEVILLAVNAIGEVTTQCYGMGILCNLTTTLENKLELIRHPSSPSLLSIFGMVLSLAEEGETTVVADELHSPRGMVTSSSSSQRKSMKNFWILKNDCCQVFFNLSHFSSASSLSPSPPSSSSQICDDPNTNLPDEIKQQIAHWQRRICVRKDLLLTCLFIATRSPSSNIQNQTRFNCLKTISNLLPIVSSLLSSSNVSVEESTELRHSFSAIYQELTDRYHTSDGDNTSACRKIALEILDQMTSYSDMLHLTMSSPSPSADVKKGTNGLVSPREPLPLSKSQKRTSKSKSRQLSSLTENDKRPIAADSNEHVADGKLSRQQTLSKKASTKMIKTSKG